MQCNKRNGWNSLLVWYSNTWSTCWRRSDEKVSWGQLWLGRNKGECSANNRNNQPRSRWTKRPKACLLGRLRLRLFSCHGNLPRVQRRPSRRSNRRFWSSLLQLQPSKSFSRGTYLQKRDSHLYISRTNRPHHHAWVCEKEFPGAQEIGLEEPAIQLNARVGSLDFENKDERSSINHDGDGRRKRGTRLFSVRWGAKTSYVSQAPRYSFHCRFRWNGARTVGCGGQFGRSRRRCDCYRSDAQVFIQWWAPERSSRSGWKKWNDGRSCEMDQRKQKTCVPRNGWVDERRQTTSEACHSRECSPLAWHYERKSVHQITHLLHRTLTWNRWYHSQLLFNSNSTPFYGPTPLS